MDVKKIDDWLKYGHTQFEVITRNDDRILVVRRLFDSAEFSTSKVIKESSRLNGKIKVTNYVYIKDFSEDCIHVILRQISSIKYSTVASSEETVEINTL